MSARYLLPYAPDAIGGLPADLPALVWDGDGPVPPADALREVEFFCLPYMRHAVALPVIGRLPALRVVQTLTAGMDDVLPHVPDGVEACNARGLHDASTAELAVTLVLASLRGVPRFTRLQDQGRWQQEFHQSLADKTVLILGYGSIGRALAARLEPFECEIVRVARRARPEERVHGVDELPGLLPAADVVVLLTPLTPESHHLVDAAFLARLKDGALLVNVARGPVVDTAALLAELTAGRLRAALDVTDPEPLPADHPLWHAPGTLITPHVGGPSSAFLPRAKRLLRERVLRFEEGEPLTPGA
ncbi:MULTISPECIES: 2-hydroxyacid dehydrogenase [Kitasatospora]|uniref:Putative oxidoreductase n=1 Tax=Kitasatospora setae (strain ATCC 33774 / DSM 43861 / JCM 3304 / KCC A-0304 / NBRC 14216 / KM-6054) TaxID=452652 RepID=E4NJB6_KITSK|nr:MULTISPECIES: 2-hydroxyacid dehydrogenase [Kitasatospora]BAJ33064.1 putative oxidoreductase [Kitasatospora setae KM-6054]